MCIIIDNDVAHRMVATDRAPEAKALAEWIENGSGRVALGGRLSKELLNNASVAAWLTELLRAGRAKAWPAKEIDAEEVRVKSAESCRSNDTHVIALARVSGTRLLFSHDKDLHADFRNRDLLSDPRGRVYQTAEHSALLRDNGCP